MVVAAYNSRILKPSMFLHVLIEHLLDPYGYFQLQLEDGFA